MDTKKNRSHITDSERDEIEILLGRGYSRQNIADALDKAKSSIVREINRNKSAASKGVRTQIPAGTYGAKLASSKGIQA